MTAEFTAETRALVAGRSGGLCETCSAAKAWDYHHRRPRGMGGTRRSDSASPTACLHVCRDCHNLLESRRNLATLFGWLVPSKFNPATQPVLYRGEWAVLGEDGSVEFERKAA